MNDFINVIRTDYGANLPFVFGQLSDLQTDVGLPAINQVQADQAAVAAGDVRARTFNTDSFEMGPDDLHFTANGYWPLGLAMGDEMAYLLYVMGQLSETQIDNGEGEPGYIQPGGTRTNEEKFILGSPIAGAPSTDFLTPDIQPATGNSFQIDFSTASGREYMIEASPTMAPGSWVEVGSVVQGINGIVSQTITPDAEDTQVFYRVRSVLP